MKKRRRSNHTLLAYRAEEALRKAVAEAIAEHRRNRVPIAIWRDGKVVRILPDETMVRDPQVEYTKSNKVRK
jgi:ribosomal protein L18E